MNQNCAVVSIYLQRRGTPKYICHGNRPSSYVQSRVYSIELSLLQTIKPSNRSLTTNAVYAEVVFKAGSFTHYRKRWRQKKSCHINSLSVSLFPPKTEITYLYEERYRGIKHRDIACFLHTSAAAPRERGRTLAIEVNEAEYYD